jgi:protein-L-isoaspartate(D-aspartate) O-methyltransferase
MTEQKTSPDPAALHAALIDQLTQRGLLDDPAIAGAFAATPRHLFLPGQPLDEVYADRAIAVKREGERWLSSSSQPAMMAIMLEQLGLAPGQRVLEIGTGTGYNAALIDRIVGPSGAVVSVDLDEDLVLAARSHLATAGHAAVDVRQADGAFGAPDAAPFERIIVTVGSWDLLPSWCEQLAAGGRIVAPISLLPGLTLSLALEERDAAWEAISARPCGFVLMRGAEAHPGRGWGTPQIRLHPRTGPAPELQAAATVEKTWNRYELRWGEETEE